MVAGLVAGLVAYTGVLAATSDESAHAFRESQKRLRQAHYAQQREENRAFRASIRGERPCAQCAALASHRKTQFAENQTFRNEQYARLVEFVKARMQEKGVSAEKQAQVLARLEERHDKVMAFLEGRFEKTIALLERLAADSGLTREEMRAALKARREEARKETEAFRESLKAAREARHK